MILVAYRSIMIRNTNIYLIPYRLPLLELHLSINVLQQKVIIHHVYCDLLIIA